MVYKEMLVELIIAQYESAKELLDGFPTETEVEKLVDELEDNISVDMNVESSDPDTEVDIKTHFDQRARNSATRDLENQLSSAKSSVEALQTTAVDSLMLAMQEDFRHATKPNWSWELEDEDSTLWSASEWLGHFQQIEDTEAFWKKALMVFSPDHPYLQSTLLDKAVLQRYPIIKSLESVHMTQAWNWLTPFLNKLKQDNGSNFNYQQAIDQGFRKIWSISAAQYARTGDAAQKSKCELLERHGFTPAPSYIDLTGIFGKDASVIEENLSRLAEISGVLELLKNTENTPEIVYSFQYLASSGSVSSSTVLAALNKENPVAASAFSKFVLEHQLHPYTNEKQTFKSRKM